MPATRILSLVVLAVAALLQATPAEALTYTPTITVGRAGGTTWDMLDPLTEASYTLTEPDENGVQTWSLTDPFVKAAYSVDGWTIDLKEDPFVTNNITITNTSGGTSTFTATVMLPIPAFAYDAVINSSIGVTVTDSNGNGSMLFDVVPATTIYDGFVGFPASTTLLAMDPIFPGTLPITTADCFPFPSAGCSATSSNGVASQAVTPGVATLIGLTLRFQLSDGDSVGITSRFEIASVPEPATVVLLGTGLVLVALARRRPA